MSINPKAETLDTAFFLCFSWHQEKKESGIEPPQSKEKDPANPKRRK